MVVRRKKAKHKSTTVKKTGTVVKAIRAKLASAKKAFKTELKKAIAKAYKEGLAAGKKSAKVTKVKKTKKVTKAKVAKKPARKRRVIKKTSKT